MLAPEGDSSLTCQAKNDQPAVETDQNKLGKNDEEANDADGKDIPEDEFVVEAIREIYENDDGKFCLVKWYGYPDSENTWEPFENVQHCPELIQECEERMKNSVEEKRPKKAAKRTGKRSNKSASKTGSKSAKKRKSQQPKTKASQPVTAVMYWQWESLSMVRWLISKISNLVQLLVLRLALLLQNGEKLSWTVYFSIHNLVAETSSKSSTKSSSPHLQDDEFSSDSSGANDELVVPLKKTKKESNGRAPSGSSTNSSKATSSSNKSATVSEEKFGFARGLQPERILGATEQNGQIFLLVKWKNSGYCDLVPSSEANKQCPQLVIAFYEERVSWTGQPAGRVLQDQPTAAPEKH